MVVAAVMIYAPLAAQQFRAALRKSMIRMRGSILFHLYDFAAAFPRIVLHILSAIWLQLYTFRRHLQFLSTKPPVLLDQIYYLIASITSYAIFFYCQ